MPTFMPFIRQLMACFQQVAVCLSMGLTSISYANELPKPVQIAFMPDLHFHDIYAQFSQQAFSGIPNSISGKHATIRSLKAELNSTRLFNENYFALLAALDDIVARKIKWVALPGDFSDDGQAVHLRGLVKILKHYQQHFGIRFFATPGNHDPVRPFFQEGGKNDFLTSSGKEIGIFSPGTPACTTHEKPSSNKPICTADIAHLGYREILSTMRDFGFFPNLTDRYWETPYSTYQYADYTFQEASKQAKLAQREYEICLQGTGGKYKKSHFSHCSFLPDASYLVEPIPGLWLLAIDANVYLPNRATTQEKAQYHGSGNAGYNKLLSHKTQVFDWIAQVVQRAKATGKQLIAFSHFPMGDFYDDQSSAIAALFGTHNFQLARRPNDDVSQALAATGLKIHVAGHMHFNDTAMIKKTGNTLFNIQAPSLAAYVPAYKLINLTAPDKIAVQTIRLKDVARFDELFEHYQQEFDAYISENKHPPWDHDILNSSTYQQFTHGHLRELTRQRFLPQEWPDDLKQALFDFNGYELLVFTQIENISAVDWQRLSALKSSQAWQQAREYVIELAAKNQIDLADFSHWRGFDLAVDFYRLRNAGSLALTDITPARLNQYRWLSQNIHTITDKTGFNPLSQFKQRLSQMLAILAGFQQGLADDNFIINTNKGCIEPCS